MNGLRRLAHFQAQFLGILSKEGGSLVTGRIQDELTMGKDFPVTEHSYLLLVEPDIRTVSVG